MAAGDRKQPTVYLDHLIERESLRYHRRGVGGTPYPKQNPPWFPLSELMREGTSGEPTLASFLRKPDFQRATLSWTANDCVLLLQSIVDRLVVPSIILWTSANSSYRYILDGAHRISVVKAWLSNDWGDKVAPQVAEDEDQEQDFKAAAQEVRDLLHTSIGSFSDYRRAYEEKRRIQEADGKPENEMDDSNFQRAVFFEDYIGLQIAFPVLWVEGDYDIAERSFLRINQGGKSLTGWETRIIEYRNSSAMRVIMSVCSPTSEEHYWPKARTNGGIQDTAITSIHDGIHQLRSTVFTPMPRRPFVPERHPIIGGISQDKKPDYLGELLCVLQGGKGIDSEILALLDIDKDASHEQILSNGKNLTSRALDGLSHLIAIENVMPSTGKYQNRSLGIVPLLYFYQDTGEFISSLVYGFVYWMLNGSPIDIMARKRAFSAYRKSFERILFLRKPDVVTGLSRKTGSGTKVTAPTAVYFDQLLRTIIRYQGNVELPAFRADYLAFTKNLLGKEAPTEFDLPDIESGGRFFSPRQKAVKAYRLHFQHHTPCEICGGFIDLTTTVQHDHKVDFATGGKTTTSNQQIAHPFCNNPETKQVIERARKRQAIADLPAFQ